MCVKKMITSRPNSWNRDEKLLGLSNVCLRAALDGTTPSRKAFVKSTTRSSSCKWNLSIGYDCRVRNKNVPEFWHVPFVFSFAIRFVFFFPDFEFFVPFCVVSFPWYFVLPLAFGFVSFLAFLFVFASAISLMTLVCWTDSLPSPPLPRWHFQLSPIDLCEWSSSPPYWHVCKKNSGKLSLPWFQRFVFSFKTACTTDVTCLMWHMS